MSGRSADMLAKSRACHPNVDREQKSGLMTRPTDCVSAGRVSCDALGNAKKWNFLMEVKLMLKSCNRVEKTAVVVRKVATLWSLVFLGFPFVLVGAEPSHAADCEVFCEGSAFSSGIGPRASAQECLDTLCLAPQPHVPPCGAGTVTDCKFDGVSILPPPVCGNGVRERAEVCDGLNTTCDQGFTACESDCTCPAGSTFPGTCGDNVVNLPGEQCDGTDDAACPGQCQSNCTCPAGAIPAVSEWGLVMMAMLLLVGAKVYFGRRKAMQG